MVLYGVEGGCADATIVIAFNGPGAQHLARDPQLANGANKLVAGATTLPANRSVPVPAGMDDTALSPGHQIAIHIHAIGTFPVSQTGPPFAKAMGIHKAWQQRGEYDP